MHTDSPPTRLSLAENDSARSNLQPFSTEEFQSRLERVQGAIQNEGLVGLMVHSPANIYYLSGYHTSGYFAYQVLFVPQRGEPLLLVREVEKTNGDEYSWLKPELRVMYADIEDPMEVTARWLAELGWLSGAQAVGVEKAEAALTVRQFESLRDNIGKVELKDASGLVTRVRLIKSPQEIKYIRQAAKILDTGFAAGLRTLAVGKTENEVVAAILEAQGRAGSEYPSLPHYLSSGRRMYLNHATPTQKVIEKGDVLKFEVSACIKRYSAAVMRTAVMGKPSEDLLRTSELLIKNQDNAFSMMRPGAVAGDVDKAVRQPVLEAGLRKTYHSRVGYSLGVGFPPLSGEWDACQFMADDKWILEANMVFHMIVNANGISFSETILVTEKGGERLGSIDRQLIVVN
ncbi:Xaa-Pro dipeptidase [Bradyrhizobium sp. LM2.7]